MVVWKKIFGAVIALGLTANPAMSQSEIEKENCRKELRPLFGLGEEKLQDEDLARLLEKFSFCAKVISEKNAETLLEENFGLDENSSPEEYKNAAKILKSASKATSGYTQIYVPGFGSVPASVQAVKTGMASAGDAEAQYLLGYIYLNGFTGKIKEGKAKKYLKRAAAQEHIQAQELLNEIENNQG